MDPNKWLTFPDDLLVDIFRRLATTAVIRSAATCRHWRRAIIDNARSLQPRPDRFFPDLLLGFFDQYKNGRLQYVPASNTEVPLLTAASTGVSVDGRLYNYLLASRDGFLLLGEDNYGDNLCLWTVQTGVCRVLPAAVLEFYPMTCKYVLVTGYDDVSDDSEEIAVRILAVQWFHDAMDGTIYQIFSSKTAAWGPVKQSAKLPEDLGAQVFNVTSDCIVCRDAVSWFVGVVPNHNGTPRECIFSMDLISGRTWTIEITTPFEVREDGQRSLFLLVVSEDWQPCLVVSSSHQIEVWVHVGDGQWTLRWIKDVQKLFPNCRNLQLCGSCPRSGYVFGTCTDYRDLPHDFIIGIDGSSPRLMERVESSSSTTIRFPLEMDCSKYMSSYLSKMKYL